MALYKNNVEINKHTFATAYAVVREFTPYVNGQMVVKIGIHDDREACMDINTKPMFEVVVRGKYDRTKNAFEEAYRIATEPYTVPKPNEETHEIEQETKYPFFYGWENDIVSE